MKHILAAVAVAAAVLVPAGSAHADPGGVCDGVVDTNCRDHACQPDELDCGLIPPCRLWVTGFCVINH